MSIFNINKMSFKELENHRISIYAMYFKTAYDMRKQYLSLAEEDVLLRTRAIVTGDELLPISDRMYQCYLEQQQCAAIEITFSGMALEAFFYDYAADALGDSFVKKHLDKLDLKSKFLIYPSLVCGHAPDQSTDTHASLVSLVKLRNDLVQFKSKQFHCTQLDKASDHYTELDELLKSGVMGAIDCVDKVMNELDALHEHKKSFRNRMCSLTN